MQMENKIGRRRRRSVLLGDGGWRGSGPKKKRLFCCSSPLPSCWMKRRPIRSRLISHPLMYARMRRPQYDRALFILSPARLLAIGTISLCGVVQYILGMGRSKSFSPHLLFSLPPLPHLISFFVSFFPLPLSGRPLHFPRLRRRRGMRFLFPYLAARREKEATKKGGELLRCLIAVVGNC